MHTEEQNGDNAGMKSMLALAALLASLIVSAHAEMVLGVKPTGSMVPTLDHRNVLHVDDRAEFSALKVGDIIVYRHPKVGLVVHRVREVRAGKVWTKGDNNARRDDVWVTPREFVGLVTRISARS